MLHEFLTAHRAEIIARARAKVAARFAPVPTTEELERGVPLFMDELVGALRRPSDEARAVSSSAAGHGGDLLRRGFTVAQVVHDYGDICQTITELAGEMQAPITIEEFHTLNGCLDDAIAAAVTEYTRLRASAYNDAASARLGALAHEVRNKLSGATLAYAALKAGRVGIGGSTAALLERSLRSLTGLIDRALAEVRIEAGLQYRERISVAELLEEIEADASLEAGDRGVRLTVAPVEPGLAIQADRATVAHGVSNLLLNAFKFGRAGGQVTLTTTGTTDRVLFAVEDECGGLPAGDGEDLFRPFTQRGLNRTGLGLGLSITRTGIEANGGEVRVANLPGKGCIFTIVLPRDV